MTSLLLASALLLPCQAPGCANGTCGTAARPAYPSVYPAAQSAPPLTWTVAPFPYHGPMVYGIPVARPAVERVEVRTRVRVKTRVRGGGLFGGLRLGGRRAVRGGCR